MMMDDAKRMAPCGRRLFAVSLLRSGETASNILDEASCVCW